MSIFDESSPRVREPDHLSPLDEPPDLQPTGLMVQQHRDSSGVGELASIAQSIGPRSLQSFERSFAAIGRSLGMQLNNQGGSLAFYTWNQKGGRIEGPSIIMMNALATEWGRIMCQVHVLDYDPRTRRALLRARVVDLLTIRAEEVDHPCTIAPTPGKFASDPAQSQRWVTMQLRSQGSRAKRNALEQVIPGHLIAIAMRAGKAAHAKLVLGDSPFEAVRDKALQKLGNGDRRLTPEVLEAWLGVRRTEWTLDELGALKVLHTDLGSGRANVVQVCEEARDNGPPPVRGEEPAPPPPTDDGVDDLGVKATADGPDIGEGDSRAELLHRVTDLEAQVAAAGGDPTRVREVCGVKRIGAKSPVERLGILIKALEVELQRINADEVVDPRKLDAIGKREQYLDNIYRMERTLGEGPVLQVRGERAAAWGDDEPFPAVQQLKAQRISDYARCLYQAGWSAE